jgi:hypothetical protein
LWAAPWLTTVEGLDRPTIVIYLFVMAAGLLPSALLLGVGIHHLRRRGISLTTMFGLVTALGMCAELALILRLPLSPLLSWIVIASMGTVTVLSFTLLGQMFTASSRANAALNSLHLSTAFIVQAGIGFLIELWTPVDGQSPAIAYQSAFAVVLAAQFIAWCVFVWPRRRRVAHHLHAHPLHGLAQQLGLASWAAMPYLHAREVWRDRLLAARHQYRAWRQAGMASLTLTGSLALWMVWGSAQSTIVPHVIEVSALHETGEIWRIPRSALLTAPALKPASAP